MKSSWQRRIERAEELANQYPFAAEILRFYIYVARFQEELHGQLSKKSPCTSRPTEFAEDLGLSELTDLSVKFESFLVLAQKRGPKQLAEISLDLSHGGDALWRELLGSTWVGRTPTNTESLLALAFLQPYAELLKSSAKPEPTQSTHALCPFCHRKPGFGVMRQMGDGAIRSLVCYFCLAEWGFRRLVCAACGEENSQKLPVYTAGEFEQIRVECCDSCKTYIKSIDLTKNGNAEPLVDELASVPLDLWAHEHGYAKLQSNLFGM